MGNAYRATTSIPGVMKRRKKRPAGFIPAGRFTLGRSISRILSSRLLRLCSHLSGQRVAASLDAAYPGLASPTRGKGTYGDEQSPIVHGRFRPCLALLPAGVTWPPALLQAPVVSYATFSPSPLARLFVSVALFRQVNASRRFPRPGYSPTPCSLECGLSSAPSTQDRGCPTGLRV